MGRLLLVVALAAPLAACTSHVARGPAWPKLHEPATDGGESIAPREAHGAAATAAADDSSGDAPAADSSAAKAAPADDSGGDGAAAPAAAPSGDPSDDTITVDGVVIDIDE